MYKITRSDTYSRDENGPSWFNDFLESFASRKESSIQDMLDAMNQKKQGDTVESVVSKYREATGLDMITAEPVEGETKTASNNFKPLSCRHASEKEQNAILVIEQNPNLKSDIESICEHSGGTKDTHAIIRFLRNELGPETGRELMKFSDDELIEYIEELKGKYYAPASDPRGNAGRIGLDDDDENDIADYITHGTSHKG